MYNSYKIAALILNYNDSLRASKLAHDLDNDPILDQILIIDNCSTDSSFIQLKKEECLNIKVIGTEHNGGYAYGNNYGMEILKKEGFDIVFICNTDVSFSKEFTKSCIKTIESGYSMVSGFMVMPDGKRSRPIDYHINSYKEDLEECFFIGRKKLRKRNRNVNFQENGVINVEMLPGSLLCVRMDDFFKAGGFDESTFLYCEERIIGRRFQDNNLKIGLISSIEYLHEHSTSISKKYNVVNKMKILYQSREYYQRAYNHINSLQKLLYEFACKVSLFEFSIRYSVMEKTK